MALFRASHCDTVTNISFDPRWDNDYDDKTAETKINTFLRNDFGNRILAMEIATWDQNFLNGGRSTWKPSEGKILPTEIQWRSINSECGVGCGWLRTLLPEISPFFLFPSSIFPYHISFFPCHWVIMSIVSHSHSQSSNIKILTYI